MLKKSLNTTLMILLGSILLYLGILFITNEASAISVTYIFFCSGLLLLTFASIGYLILNYRTKHKPGLFIQAVALLIVGIVCYGNVGKLLALIPIILGVWFLLLGIVKLITSYLMFHDHLPHARTQVAITIFDLLVGCALIFHPQEYSSPVIIFTGIYFILYGLFFLYRSLIQFIPTSWVEDIDHRFQLAVPTMIGALLPPHLMKVILSNAESEKHQAVFDVMKQKGDCDLEVVVHVAKSGPAQLGHCDLSYHGTLLSYGCYDPHTRHLFGTYGDGVVILAPRDEYLYNCLANENKVLVAFGLKLNEKQKEQLNQELLASFAKFEPFLCDESIKRQGGTPKGICDDYLSRVTRNVCGAHYYKISSGKFRTFFVFYTNCVTYVSRYLSKIGFSILHFSGIISPGAYYDFLNNEFKSGKGCVIYRKIYTAKDAALFKQKQSDFSGFKSAAFNSEKKS